MTAKLVEDLFLADDLEGSGSVGAAQQIREADTHEEVEEIRAKLVDLFDRLLEQ